MDCSNEDYNFEDSHESDTFNSEADDTFSLDGSFDLLDSYFEPESCTTICHQYQINLTQFKNLCYFQNESICPNTQTKALFLSSKNARVWILKDKVYTRKDVTLEEMDKSFELDYDDHEDVSAAWKRINNFCIV